MRDQVYTPAGAAERPPVDHLAAIRQVAFALAQGVTAFLPEAHARIAAEEGEKLERELRGDLAAWIVGEELSLDELYRRAVLVGHHGRKALAGGLR